MNTITVTDKTTLGELLTILDLAEKSGKTAHCSATALRSIRISPDVLLFGCRTAKASLSILIS